ncbi:hypothetical protein AMECASPLE_022696 [Ameca splendens]|uniref:Uncharacterized protein n=1 Tax=Ameca splendens TaxID=208324 RepID=A0ABV0YFA9_9TELE
MTFTAAAALPTFGHQRYIPPVADCTLTRRDASADGSAAPLCLYAATVDMDNPVRAAAASSVLTISHGCHQASNLVYSTC